MTAQLVLPALVFVMMLSTTSVTGNLFRSPREVVIPLLTALLVNYIAFGGLILVLSGVFLLQEAFKVGFIILAAVPQAVAVTPFTSILKGDTKFSLIGTLSCFLGALIITPLITSLK